MERVWKRKNVFKNHGYRVRLFSGGTTGAPNLYDLVAGLLFFFQNMRYYIIYQGVKMRLVSEKTGKVCRDRVKHHLHFFAV